MAEKKKRTRKPKVYHRPCMLTAEVEAKIVGFIRKGCFATVASAAAGVSYPTFKRWLNSPAAKFRRFAKAVERARAEARAEAEQAVFMEDRAMWLRLGPGRDAGPDAPGWTERPATARVEHTGPGGGPIAHGVQVQAQVQVDAVSVVLDPVARRLACELLERHSDLDARAALPGGPGALREQGAVEARAAPGAPEPPAG